MSPPADASARPTCGRTTPLTGRNVERVAGQEAERICSGSSEGVRSRGERFESLGGVARRVLALALLVGLELGQQVLFRGDVKLDAGA